MTFRAYSVLNVKSVDEDRRIITGVASTPTPDRVRDVVMPLGAKFATPMPLLLYHNGEKPVGTVDFAKPSSKGIPFKASLPNVVEEGIVRDRVQEAWHSIKYKLIAAVSIGFRAMEGGVEMIRDGGLKFNEWEWLELSLVSVPAQPDAVINSFKSMDREQIHALLGTHPSDSDAERQALIKSLCVTDVYRPTPVKVGCAECGFKHVDAIGNDTWTNQKHICNSRNTQARAASGHTRKGVALIKSPDVSGQQQAAPRGPVKLIPRNRKREEATSRPD